MRKIGCWLLCLQLWAPLAAAQVNWQELAERFAPQRGFVSFLYDNEQGKLYLRVENSGEEFIYQTSLPQGVGSNDIGLDRGQLSSTRLVEFQPAGDKLLLVQKNTAFRALSDNPSERAAVADAFASAVLWGFPVVERGDGWLVVDASDFVLQDAHGLARRMEQAGQGDYRLDKTRSALHAASSKSFPANTELEAIISFSGEKPGQFVRQVAADPYLLSVRMRHSFIRLPEPGYQPRAFHPQSGYWPFSFQDYAQPVNQPITQRFIARHRLEKRNPQAALSEPVEPIVYYLDPGAPEPIRTALLEGGSWWNQAFEAIGYKDAFRVELLPAGADLLDVRYNVIQWVHRATRGWSYGMSLTDPRTGEIIKGHVTLGSLRVRQDYLIAQALLAPFAAGEDDAALMELALARIRQLSAHEIGHTLGIAHNFAASSYGRASVMDYPHPLFELDGDRISADNAYAEGIGEWDKAAIAYGYQEFPPAQEARALQDILAATRARGMIFLTDQDARGPGDMHPLANLWDNGADPIAELERVKQLRVLALSRFGAANLAPGRYWSDLEEVLVPLYYFHRYQAEAAAKSLGGVLYHYAVKGEDETAPEGLAAPVAAATQKQALESLIATLEPGFLSISDELAAQLAPKAFGSARSRESLEGNTGRGFDRIDLAARAAQHSLSLLLHPQRLARLAQQRSQDTQIPGPAELAELLHERIVAQEFEGLEARLHQRVVDLLYANYLNLLHDARVDHAVRVQIHGALRRAHEYLQTQARRSRRGADYRDFYAYQAQRLEDLQVEDRTELIKLPEMPPGAPI